MTAADNAVLLTGIALIAALAWYFFPPRTATQAPVKGGYSPSLLAFGYNVAAIPIAAGLLYPFTGALLSPLIAATAMAISIISVVLDIARLNRFGPAGMQPRSDSPARQPAAAGAR